MPNVGEGILGGIGGLLSTGNPIGAAAGFLGGLFGSDDQQQQTTNYTYSQLSGAQQNLTNLGNDQLAALMAQLSPDAQNAMIAQLQGQFSDVLGQQATDAFNLQSGRARANMARTGGGPSSVLSSQLAELGTARTKALNQAESQATLMANQIGGQRFQQSLAATQGIGGLINQAESTRRVTSQTGTTSVPGGNMGTLLGGIGSALTDSGSYFNQNVGSFGVFGAPIFGGTGGGVTAGNASAGGGAGAGQQQVNPTEPWQPANLPIIPGT
jgi:hypothetical protein